MAGGGETPLCLRGCALSAELKLQPELCKDQDLGEIKCPENEIILCPMPSQSKTEACTPVNRDLLAKHQICRFTRAKEVFL